MAKQLLVDFYGCDDTALNSIDVLTAIVRKIVDRIDSVIVEESFHLFKPYGITYVAIIAKSHVSIHTWPEKNTIALDIFSCDDDLPHDFVDELKEDFHAKEYQMNMVQRNV